MKDQCICTSGLVAKQPPYTAESLQRAILGHLVERARTLHPHNENDHVGQVVGNVMICPNSSDGYANIKTAACVLGLEPFFQNHATYPLGEVYIIADRKAKTVGIRSRVLLAPHGVSVFS